MLSQSCWRCSRWILSILGHLVLFRRHCILVCPVGHLALTAFRPQTQHLPARIPMETINHSIVGYSWEDIYCINYLWTSLYLKNVPDIHHRCHCSLRRCHRCIHAMILLTTGQCFRNHYSLSVHWYKNSIIFPRYPNPHL